MADEERVSEEDLEDSRAFLEASREDGGMELAVGKEEETKPEVVMLTPAEFAALKAQSDSARAIREGIEGLSSKMGAPQPYQQPAPVNAPTQTPEEFFAEHQDDLFDKEKGAKVLAEYNKMLMEREYAPIIANVSGALAATRKELLEAKDPHFKRYASEVEALVAAQEPKVRLQPDVYERAWANVRQRHQAEIEEENLKAKVDEAVAARLKELGVDPTKPAARPPAYQNSAGASSGSGTPVTRKRVYVPDVATKEKLEREALKKGLDINDYLRSKGYGV